MRPRPLAVETMQDSDSFCAWSPLFDGLDGMHAEETMESGRGDADEVPHTSEKRSCAARRKRETQALRTQIEQLQSELDKLTSKRHLALARTQEQWEGRLHQEVGARTRARQRNSRLRTHVAQETRKCVKTNVLLRKMIAPMKVTRDRLLCLISPRPHLTHCVLLSYEGISFLRRPAKISLEDQAGRCHFQCAGAENSCQA